MSAKEIMSIIDDVKKRLTDDEYLKLSNLLAKRNSKEQKKYKITYIKQTPTIRLDGDIVFQQKIKTKIAYIKDKDYELCCNNLAKEENVLIRFDNDLMIILKACCYNGAFLFNEDEDDENNNKHIIYIEKLLLSIKPIDDI